MSADENSVRCIATFVDYSDWFECVLYRYTTPIYSVCIRDPVITDSSCTVGITLYYTLIEHCRTFVRGVCQNTFALKFVFSAGEMRM